jgi:hypothetical protein
MGKSYRSSRSEVAAPAPAAAATSDQQPSNGFLQDMLDQAGAALGAWTGAPEAGVEPERDLDLPDWSETAGGQGLEDTDANSVSNDTPLCAGPKSWQRATEDQEASFAATECGLGQSTTAGGDRYLYDFLDPQTGPDELIGPDSAQFLSRTFPHDEDQDGTHDGVRTLEDDGSVTELLTNASGMVELSPMGRGFTTHNRNDVDVDGVPLQDQCGAPSHVAAVMNTMADYETQYPGSEVSLGDLSTCTGDSPLLFTDRTVRHETHFDGSQVDLQYPQGEASTNVAPTSGPDIGRTQTLVDGAQDWGMDHIYGAPSLRDDLEFDAGTSSGFNKGHANHLHMGTGTGRRTAP